MQFDKAKGFILEKLGNELPDTLTYHSLAHVKDVYSAAQMLADLENVASEDLTLLLTAVLYHDSGFVIQQLEHERISCEIARQYLPTFDYTAQQIEVICGMIMATKIPQTPHNLLEKIICDSDLDYLGRDDFFEIGDTLYNELRNFGVVNNENDWNKLQVNFLSQHHYFTNSAIKLRAGKKEEHIALVKAKIQN